MKKNLMLTLAMFATGSLLAADASPKDEVISAANALNAKSSYSWHASVETGGGGVRRGPTDGKSEKDGYTTVSFTANDSTTEFAFHGTKAALKTADSNWMSAEEAAQEQGNGFNVNAFMARLAQNFRPPAVEAAELAGLTQGLTAGTNGITGDLTEEGAKSLLLFRRAGSNAGGPTVANPKGSITFWIHDGLLVKYQTHVTGTINYNNNQRDVDRTTITEIKDVGTTKVEVADDAKKKLE